MYMGLCPGGAEGTALAAIQTFASLAVMTSTNIGECLGEEDGQEEEGRKKLLARRFVTFISLTSYA
jgi:hypothetical protein